MQLAGARHNSQSVNQFRSAGLTGWFTTGSGPEAPRDAIESMASGLRTSLVASSQGGSYGRCAGTGDSAPLGEHGCVMLVGSPRFPRSDLAGLAHTQGPAQALARAYEEQAAANERLQQYAATVEDLTISRERNRLARELHDTLAHSLSAVTVQLEAVRSLWQVDPERGRSILDQADATARTGLTEARRALRDLRASPLQDLGLVLALRDLGETAAKRSGASLELHLPTQVVGHLPPVVEQGIYRIAQESLENVVRHAQASAIALTLELAEGALLLVIEDDGLGTSPDDAKGEEGLGIRGMQERARLIGGQLRITAGMEGGTRVEMTVPE